MRNNKGRGKCTNKFKWSLSKCITTLKLAKLTALVKNNLLMALCLHWTFPAWCNAYFPNYSHNVAKVFVKMNGNYDLRVHLPLHWVFCIFRGGESVPIMMPLGSKQSLFHRRNSKSIARWRHVKSVKQEHSKASKCGSRLISKCAPGGGGCKTREILQWIWLDRLDMLHILFLLWFCKLALICMTERCWKQMTEVKFSELSFSTQPLPPLSNQLIPPDSSLL